MLDGDLVHKVCPARSFHFGAGHFCSGRNRRVSHVRLLHIFASFRLSYATVAHNFFVDFHPDILELLVHFLVEPVKLFALQLILALLPLRLLDLLPKVMANHRPNLLIHEQVLLGGQVVRNFILKAEVLDSLLLKQILVELLHGVPVAHHERQIVEVVLPQLELTNRDAIVF